MWGALGEDHLGRKRLVVDRSKIVEMHAAGMTVRAIAEKFGISHGSAPPDVGIAESGAYSQLS